MHLSYSYLSKLISILPFCIEKNPCKSVAHWMTKPPINKACTSIPLLYLLRNVMIIANPKNVITCKSWNTKTNENIVLCALMCFMCTFQKNANLSSAEYIIVKIISQNSSLSLRFYCQKNCKVDLLKTKKDKKISNNPQ